MVDRVRSAVSLLVFALSFWACRAIEPEVGPFRRACLAENPYAKAADAAPGGVDPRCAPEEEDVAEPCETCENEKCCATRFGCYDDSACNCADQALDECLQGIESEGSPDAPARRAQCWGEFAESGDEASARAACLRAQCETECELSP